MKFLFAPAVLFIIFTSNCFAQQDSVLAKVGPDIITGGEFKERFELTPQVYKNEENHYSKKEDLLYSIIAEKLWALEAAKLGFDTTKIMGTSFRALENMYIRDALYKNEISHKIKISDQEVIDGLKNHFTKLDLKVLSSNDSSEIYSSYEELKNGISFDSLKVLENEKENSVAIKSGELSKPLEDSIFNLKSGQFSPPVKSNSGWMIFYLANKEKESYTSEDIESAVKDIKQKIENEKSKEIGEEYLEKFFRGKEVSYNPVIFQSISGKISEIMQERKLKENIPDTASVYLKNEDILKIENELGPDTLKINFLNFEKDPYTVEDFLRYFIFEGFYSNDVKPEIISTKLQARTRMIFENELLAREGYKLGLENLPDVQSAINMWRDNYLAQLLKDKLLDSVKVSDDEIRNYYYEISKEKNPNDVQVNIREILTDSLDVVHQVLDQLKEGAEFGKLAAIHTKRIWTRANDGEFGYFPSSMYGEIGSTAAKMKVGEIYGPIKTPDGYSIFQLIGKKEKEEIPPQPFDKMKDKLKKELLGKKRSEFIIDYTVGLANKFGVSINENFLSRINADDFNMYVYRYMGFGGRIPAVPVTLPFTEWYKPWKEGKKVVP